MVTGANSGLGLVTARELARAGASVEPGLEGGTYVGPGGIAEQRGHPKPVSPSGAARNEQVAHRLWEVSEEMTGVSFSDLGPSRAEPAPHR